MINRPLLFEFMGSACLLLLLLLSVAERDDICGWVGAVLPFRLAKSLTHRHAKFPHRVEGGRACGILFST